MRSCKSANGPARSDETESHELSSKEGFTCHLPFSYEAVKTELPKILGNSKRE